VTANSSRRDGNSGAFDPRRECEKSEGYALYPTLTSHVRLDNIMDFWREKVSLCSTERSRYDIRVSTVKEWLGKISGCRRN